MVFLCALLAVASPTDAVEIPSLDNLSAEDIEQYETVIREFYSMAIQQYGDLLGGFIGNERMNIYIEGLDSPVYAVTENNELKDMGAGELDDHTMNVYSDIGTLAEIAMGETAPLDALKDGRIRFEGVGFMSALKMFFAQIALFFYSLFGGV